MHLKPVLYLEQAFLCSSEARHTFRFAYIIDIKLFCISILYQKDAIQKL
jgi:hypothetical protein